MREVRLGRLDSPGVEFEIYAYSDLKKNKEAMLKALKCEAAKEDSERVKNLKNVFYNFGWPVVQMAWNPAASRGWCSRKG